tara:strand:+ start:1574 stop:1711 length:138 start_codon:yes stop_codon:yes gene_type:complete
LLDEDAVRETSINIKMRKKITAKHDKSGEEFQASPGLWEDYQGRQ